MLTKKQEDALVLIRDYPGMTGEHHGISQSLLTNLEKAGYIKRKDDSGKVVTSTWVILKSGEKMINAPLPHPGIGHNSDQGEKAATPGSYQITADELRQFVERFERLEAEKRDIMDRQKEVMAEAKGRGYDTKIMRRIIALRKRDPNDIAEEEAVLEMYKQALGM